MREARDVFSEAYYEAKEKDPECTDDMAIAAGNIAVEDWQNRLCDAADYYRDLLKYGEL